MLFVRFVHSALKKLLVIVREVTSCAAFLFQDAHIDRLQFAEFFLKCSEHTSQGEDDQGVPLDLIKPNIRDVPCLACTEVRYEQDPDIMIFMFLSFGT